MTAETAKEFGIIDQVIERSRRARASDGRNLRLFRVAPLRRPGYAWGGGGGGGEASARHGELVTRRCDASGANRKGAVRFLALITVFIR